MIFRLAFLLTVLGASTSCGSLGYVEHPDPVPVEDRLQAKQASTSYLSGSVECYDVVEARTLRLSDGVLVGSMSPSGPFMVGPASFRDQFGRRVEVDLYLIRRGQQYDLSAPVVRAIDGKTR